MFGILGFIVIIKLLFYKLMKSNTHAINSCDISKTIHPYWFEFYDKTECIVPVAMLKKENSCL